MSFIKHDLSVVTKICDFINIMYADNIVESNNFNKKFYNPKYIKELNLCQFNQYKFIPIKVNQINIRITDWISIYTMLVILRIIDNHETSCFKYLKYLVVRDKE